MYVENLFDVDVNALKAKVKLLNKMTLKGASSQIIRSYDEQNRLINYTSNTRHFFFFFYLQQSVLVNGIFQK